MQNRIRENDKYVYTASQPPTGLEHLKIIIIHRGSTRHYQLFLIVFLSLIFFFKTHNVHSFIIIYLFIHCRLFHLNTIKQMQLPHQTTMHKKSIFSRPIERGTGCQECSTLNRSLKKYGWPTGSYSIAPGFRDFVWSFSGGLPHSDDLALSLRQQYM